HYFLLRPAPTAPSPLPYTTLFRSGDHPAVPSGGDREVAVEREDRRHRVFVVRQGPDRTDEREVVGRVDRDRSRGSRGDPPRLPRSEEHTSELQSQSNLVCRLLLEK